MSFQRGPVAGEPLFPYEIWQAIVESLPIVAVDVETSKVSFSNAWADRMFGYPRFGLIGVQFGEVVPKESGDYIKESLKGWRDNPQPRTLPAVDGVRKDGGKVRVSVFMLPVTLHGTDIIVVVLAPVTPTPPTPE